MTPVNFPEANYILNKPEDMTDEQCSRLPVCYAVHPIFNLPMLISKWQLSEEELKLIVKTKHIYLNIFGTTHPPVIPLVESPFDELNTL